VPVGRAKLDVQAVVSTGDDGSSSSESDEFFTVAQTFGDGAGAASYWSYMVVTSPHGPSDVNDLGVSLQNMGLGLTTIQGQLSFPIDDDISGRVAAGWLKATQDNPVNEESNMGTEIVGEITVALGGGLALDLGAAGFFAGDFYRGSSESESPADLWEAFARFQLEF
jgi:hypothetical protein